MTQMNYFLTKTDDIYINCYKAVKNVATVPASFTSIFTTDTVLLNILYNVGYQFTDILDLIFWDMTDTNPWWYYAFFRVGDFLIRFVYRNAN